GTATHRLDDVSVAAAPGFRVVLLTSLDRERPLSAADRWLVTTVARARNTGMEISDDGRLVAPGEAPLLLEPVVADLQLKRRRGRVWVLDHTGRRTGRSFAFRQGKVHLDGAEHRTTYYEIDFR
ncbi:MAG: hypothetical protein WBA12_07025, partial [Catalinimonas sp.]